MASCISGTETRVQWGAGRARASLLRRSDLVAEAVPPGHGGLSRKAVAVQET
jgi:hypothetical protein